MNYYCEICHCENATEIITYRARPDDGAFIRAIFEHVCKSCKEKKESLFAKKKIEREAKLKKQNEIMWERKLKNEIDTFLKNRNIKS